MVHILTSISTATTPRTLRALFKDVIAEMR